ncbi:MAG TPA: hypothetical protein VJ001_02600 [Rhodocyclaceae bacterium]|nr:hypothetical protein [Rhodocyclaceae bacterium]
MSSITPTVIDACGDDFKTIRYPQATERVKEAQQKFSSMLSRVVAVGHTIEAMRL